MENEVSRNYLILYILFRKVQIVPLNREKRNYANMEFVQST